MGTWNVPLMQRGTDMRYAMQRLPTSHLRGYHLEIEIPDVKRGTKFRSEMQVTVKLQVVSSFYFLIAH